MSAPVDVLAVMADVRSAAGDYDAERLQGIAAGDVFDEARAAVAELIEVAKKARDRLLVSGFQADALVAVDLIAALARVGGGK